MTTATAQDIPEDLTHAACPRCERSADTHAAVLEHFGLRFNDTKVQSYCRACRRLPCDRTDVWDFAENELTFGVEVEWASHHSRSDVASGVASYLREQGWEDAKYRFGRFYSVRVTGADGERKTFKFVTDNTAGGEMVTPILRLADMELLQAVVRGMRDAGARSDRGVGIHIHVGAQNLTIGQVRNVARYQYRWEDHLRAAANIAPGREHWARPTERDFIESLDRKGSDLTGEELDAIWYETNPGSARYKHQKYHSSRYQGLNLHALFYHGTLEFRWFNGTLHAGKVKSYVNLMVGFVARGAVAKQASSKRKDFDNTDPDGSMKALLSWLDITQTDFESTRFHLINNARASRGESRHDCDE